MSEVKLLGLEGRYLGMAEWNGLGGNIVAGQAERKIFGLYRCMDFHKNYIIV